MQLISNGDTRSFQSVINCQYACHEKNLNKKGVTQLKKIDAWLNDEQVRFSEQYYKNFEKHPEASSSRHKRIIQKYKKMTSEGIFLKFKEMYSLYTEDKIEEYTGKLLKESPQKELKKLEVFNLI
mgnify:CR=1 FL=1